MADLDLWRSLLSAGLDLHAGTYGDGTVIRSEQSCSNCYYVGRPKQLGQNYLCQRNAPILQWMLLPQQQNPLDPKSIVMQPTACGGWPNTEPEGWCGEHRPMTADS